MFKYVLKRVLIGFVTLFVLGSATFFLMKATPGSPVNGERFKSKDWSSDVCSSDLAHGDLG